MKKTLNLKKSKRIKRSKQFHVCATKEEYEKFLYLKSKQISQRDIFLLGLDYYLHECNYGDLHKVG